MEYSYVALDSEGIKIKGIINAPDSQEARKIISGQKLDIISVKQSLSRNILKAFKGGNPKLSSREFITILLNIGELDRMGMSMIDIMEILKDDVATGSRMKVFCKKVYISVKSGSTLSESFEYHKGYIDPIFCNLVKIGEDTGGYNDIFTKIIHYVKSSDKIKRSVKSILFKGISSILFIIGLTLAISLIVIPKSMSFLKENNIPIPWYTQSMVNVANFLADRYIVVSIVILSVYFSIKLISKLSYAFRKSVDKTKLKLPLLGDLIMNIEAARFTAFFNIMYEAGTRVEIIFARVKDIIKNRHIKLKLKEAEKMILNGQLPQEALNITMPFSRQLIRIITVGFASGNINEVLKNAGYFLERDIEEKIDILVSTIKPTMMVATGLLVAWMAISVFGPIYSNLGNFSDNNALQKPKETSENE